MARRVYRCVSRGDIVRYNSRSAVSEYAIGVLTPFSLAQAANYKQQNRLLLFRARKNRRVRKLIDEKFSNLLSCV